MYDDNVLTKVGHDGNIPTPFEPAFISANELIASFNRYHRIGFWEFNSSKKTVHWSKETFAIHGIDSNEDYIPVAKALSFYIEEDRAKVEQIIHTAIVAQQGFHFKLRIKRADGEIRMVETIGDFKKAEAGEDVVLYGTFRDITSQTQFENSRVGQKDLISRMIKSVPIPAFITDQKLRYILVNERFQMEFNAKDNEFQPSMSHLNAFPDMPTNWKQGLKMALSGKPVGQSRDVFQRAGGEKYLLDWVLQPWTAQTGQVGGVVMLLKIHKFFPRVAEAAAQHGQLIDNSQMHAVSMIPPL